MERMNKPFLQKRLPTTQNKHTGYSLRASEDALNLPPSIISFSLLVWQHITTLQKQSYL